MLDCDSGSSYVCTSLLTKLGEKPIRKGNRTIEHLYGSLRKTFKIFKVRLQLLLFKKFLMEERNFNLLT